MTDVSVMLSWCPCGQKEVVSQVEDEIQKYTSSADIIEECEHSTCIVTVSACLSRVTPYRSGLMILFCFVRCSSLPIDIVLPRAGSRVS